MTTKPEATKDAQPNAGGGKGSNKQKGPATKFVLDTTATAESGPRKHEQIIGGRVVAFTFEPGKPLEMPEAVAVKFLKHDAFQLADADGKVLEYKRRPKQPDELEAGEQIKLGENETIARYDELSLKALFNRALELPGGEKFAKAENKPEAKDLIAFIKKVKAERQKANTAKEPDVGPDEFTPEAELDAA